MEKKFKTVDRIIRKVGGEGEADKKCGTIRAHSTHATYQICWDGYRVSRTQSIGFIDNVFVLDKKFLRNELLNEV
jgi:hypothetical protein